MLDPRRLRVLREVARRRSFSAAADALGYTQSAISQQVAALERSVGVPLLERLPRDVRPTAAGEVLVRHAETILARIADAEAELEELRGGRTGLVRVVAFPTAGATILPRAVAAHRVAHPGVELDLRIAEVPDALRLLRAGEADLAVVVEDPEAPLPEPELERTALLDDRYSVVLPVGHRLDVPDGAPLDLAELADEPWLIGRHADDPDDAIVLRACRAAGFAPRVVVDSDDYLAIQGFVASGVGVALVPDLAMVVLHDGVVVRDPADAPSRRVLVVRDARAWRAPAADAMVDGLRRAGADVAAGHDRRRTTARTLPGWGGGARSGGATGGRGSPSSGRR